VNFIFPGAMIAHNFFHNNAVSSVFDERPVFDPLLNK
jgi:hypothetical protein